MQRGPFLRPPRNGMQGRHPDRQNVVCHSSQQRGHYANECPNKVLYCDDEYESKEYDEHIEVGQPDDAQQQAALVTNVKAREGPLLVFRFLMTTEKEDLELWRRTSIFRTSVRCKGKVCNLSIDSESCMNIVSQEAVEKLKLPTTKHPKPYRTAWIDDYCLLDNHQCSVPLKIGP